MRCDCGQKVDDQSDARRDTESRPPDSECQSQSPGKLASCQQWKVLEGNADYFVDDLHYVWIVAKFAESGTQQRAGQRACDHQICNAHNGALLSASYGNNSLAGEFAVHPRDVLRLWGPPLKRTVIASLFMGLKAMLPVNV